MTSPKAVLAVLCFVAILLVGCGQKQPAQQTAPPAQSTAAPQPSTTASTVPLPAPFGRHTDDLDGMLQRHNVRALVILNPIDFFYNNGQPMGIMYEALRDFETFVNQKQKTKALKIKVTFIPVRPDQAEPALLQGVGDFIASPVVITPEREQRAAFTVPAHTGVDQVIVTGPGFPAISSLDDLGGKEVYANPVSVNYQGLEKVNDKLKQNGKPQIVIKAADPNLTEDDLVQMVSAGLIPATVSRIARAKFWAQILPNLTVHPDLVVDSDEQVAWALRKDNPQLKQLLDQFMGPRAVGTSFGSTLVRRYLQNTKWVRNSTSGEELKKFQQLSAIFQKYAGQYDFDYLLIMAQSYQESMLNQAARAPDGTVGLMQVNPRLAAANPINIRNVNTPDGNVEAGVKMLHQIENQYFNDPKLDPVDKTLMTFASYNAGPNRIARLRKQAADQGLDPNKWFNNVELVVARDIGQVTVNYVSNIYKYYVAYKLALADKNQTAKTN